MPPIPREKSIDSTLALARDPYGFVADRRRVHGGDLFEARLLLERTICMTGPDAAELSYDRVPALPRSGIVLRSVRPRSKQTHDTLHAEETR